MTSYRTRLEIRAFRLSVQIGFTHAGGAKLEYLFVRRASVTHITTEFATANRSKVILHLEGGRTYELFEPNMDVANATAQMLAGYIFNDDNEPDTCPAIRSIIDPAADYRHRWENDALTVEEQSAGFRW